VELRGSAATGCGEGRDQELAEGVGSQGHLAGCRGGVLHEAPVAHRGQRSQHAIAGGVVVRLEVPDAQLAGGRGHHGNRQGHRDIRPPDHRQHRQRSDFRQVGQVQPVRGQQVAVLRGEELADRAQHDYDACGDNRGHIVERAH
jgi:hypothetical protein